MIFFLSGYCTQDLGGIEDLMYPNVHRAGILMCLRNNGERYYSDQELIVLKNMLSKYGNIDVVDTTIDRRMTAYSKDLKEYIDNYIKKFTKYKIVITDRYYGTIFSLIANTSVIVIRTTDHNVSTGVEWFNKIYDSFELVEVLNKILEVVECFISRKEVYNKSYFEQEYYRIILRFLEV